MLKTKKSSTKRKSRNPLKNTDPDTTGRDSSDSSSGPSDSGGLSTDVPMPDLGSGDLSDPDTDDTPSKRSRAEALSGSSAASSSTTTTTTSRILTASRHDDLPAMTKVRLQPLITLDGAGAVKNVQISSQQRTPSPFGGPMGDHTVAWSAVVDGVRARLHGRTLDQALDAMITAQRDAEAWMSQPDSAGMRLFDMLPDRDQRVGPLENWAWLNANQLAAAKTTAADGDIAQATKHLQQAVATHLAYLNFLPFATVPAASARGSKGSSEGWKRQRILAVEKQAGPDNAPLLDVDDAAFLREQLWGMFAFDAALRESDASLLFTDELATAQAELTTLTDLRKRLEKEIDRQTSGGLATDAKAIEAEAAALAKGTVSKVMQTAAGRIRDGAKEMSGLAGVPSARSRQKIVLDRKAAVATAEANATTAVAQLVARAENAGPRAALMLAELVHEHQRTVAAAYPRAVIVSSFLVERAERRPVIGPVKETAARVRAQAEADAAPAKAAKAATDRIQAEILKAFPGAPADKLAAFMTALGKDYAKITPTPTPAATNSWTTDASNEDLVVTYDPAAAEPLTVNGRAAAPTGVAGMGSHTTAWTVEVTALQAMVRKAGSAEKALEVLKAETLRDMKSKVMELDRLLPADQLEAGQVLDIFAQAETVLDATDVAEAATAFLNFRNLLPFATLDAGGRGGKGERSTGPRDVNFDKDSLNEAAELVQHALDDTETRKQARAALTSAADQLAKVEWHDDDALKTPAQNTIKRLQAAERALAKGAPTNVVTTITEARTDEHRRVYAQATG